MRFNEIFLNSNPDIKKISNVGAATFSKGVTDKNKSRTPHYEIKEELNMYSTNTIVQSGVDQLASFIIPNKNINFASKDPKTKKFLEDWHKKRKGIKDEYKNVLITNLVCGNGPMEKNYITMRNNTKVLDNVFAVNNMEKLYINPDDIGGDTNYIYELDVGIKSLYYNGEWQTPQYYQIRYIKNYNWYMEMIYGIIIKAEKMSIYRSGWSRDNIYGRGGLASAIDANNIFKEILSSWDTIARTRQIDHKILSISDPETGVNITQTQLDDLAEKLNDSTDSYNIINIPLKNVFEKDIKTSGNYDLMEGVFELLRKLIMMSLLPQHLTPWADSATTQGSEAAMPPFALRVKAKQNDFIEFLNAEVIGELRKSYPWLAEDATFVFDEPIIMGAEYYINIIGRLIELQIITSEQGRKYLTKLGIVDKDLIETQLIEREQINSTEKFDGQGEITFHDFKTRLTTEEKIEEIDFKNVDGHSVRLIKTPHDYQIYDGLLLKSSIDIRHPVSVARDLLDAQIKIIKKEQDEFESGQSKEDIIIDDAQKQIDELIKAKLDIFIDKIEKTKTKKEDFLGVKILDKFDDIFKGINIDFDSIISKTLNKLGMDVVDIKEVDDQKDKDLLYDKKALLIKNVQDQLKTTKDVMLQDIKRTLIDGITAGKSPTQIKSEIEKSYNYEDGIAWKFSRSLQTSLRQSSNLLKLQKYLKMGITEFKWAAVMDSKTRDEHREYNGKVFKIQDALDGKIIFPGGSLIPNKPNINCRCRLIPYS